MKAFTTQIFLAVVAVIFLLKGGIGILAAAWKFVIPMMFLGGAYYFGKKAFKSFNLPADLKEKAGRMGASKANAQAQATAGASAGSGSVHKKAGEAGGVIEICPHCLSEVGSCPKCR